MSDMTRDEHLAWAKKRALEYWQTGELRTAVTSMASDLEKHPELRSTGPTLALLGILYAADGDSDGVRRWIEGFR